MEAVNPYQTPTEELATETGEYAEAKLFSPNCRVGRVRYLARLLTTMLASYLGLIPIGIIAAVLAENQAGAAVIAVMAILLWVAIGALSIIFAIQRLHDLNMSGWWCLLMFVPLVNVFFSLFVMFWPGTQGANNYGNRPLPARWYHWLAALIVPFVFVGILAAVALPAYQDYVERAQQMQL